MRGRCNWYHATLNIGETLAAGGQQAEGSDIAAGPCADDVDATANAQFHQATKLITDGVMEESETLRAQSLAAGEVLLQTALEITPYRLDAWLWVKASHNRHSCSSLFLGHLKRWSLFSPTTLSAAATVVVLLLLASPRSRLGSNILVLIILNLPNMFAASAYPWRARQRRRSDCIGQHSCHAI